MEAAEIDDVVCQIMVNDGPDRHVDGHEIITAFIVALLNGEGQIWKAKYEAAIEDRKQHRINLAGSLKNFRI